MIDGNLKTILEEMCRRVNTSFDEIDFNSKDWFTTHEWTPKEQDGFREWLIEFLSDKKHRIGFMAFPNIGKKKELEKAANWFIFDYGWKCNYE